MDQVIQNIVKNVEQQVDSELDRFFIFHYICICFQSINILKYKIIKILTLFQYLFRLNQLEGDELDKLREMRLEGMKKRAQQKKEWLTNVSQNFLSKTQIIAEKLILIISGSWRIFRVIRRKRIFRRHKKIQRYRLSFL